MDFETKNCRKCGEKLDSRLFACLKHWNELPNEIKDGIRISYINNDYHMYERLTYRADWFWKRGDLPA